MSSPGQEDGTAKRKLVARDAPNLEGVDGCDCRRQQRGQRQRCMPSPAPSVAFGGDSVRGPAGLGVDETRMWLPRCDLAQSLMHPCRVVPLREPACSYPAVGHRRCVSPSSDAAAGCEGCVTVCECVRLLIVPSLFAHHSRGSPPGMSMGMRHSLASAVSASRDALGSADQIPGDALLVVAVQSSTSHPSRSRRPRPRRVEGSYPLHQVVGLCIARELDVAWRLHVGVPACTRRARAPLAESDDDGGARNDAGHISLGVAGHGHVECGGECVSPRHEVGDTWCTGSRMCGIQHIWVHASKRRRGIGSAMVDAARLSVAFGYAVPPNHVAFSEPTIDGRRLASAYAGRGDYLVF